jgi:hypothetical protein
MAMLIAFLGIPVAFAGDQQVHPGVACQQGGYEDASARTWRSLGGYLANNSGSSKYFICPALNDTITTGVSYASVYVYSDAQCYVGATAWGAWSGAFSPTQTGTLSSLSYLALGAVNTPGGSIYGNYNVICVLPNNAAILHYYIDQK